MIKGLDAFAGALNTVDELWDACTAKHKED